MMTRQNVTGTASCGHPRNADGECDCSCWPEPCTHQDPISEHANELSNAQLRTDQLFGRKTGRHTHPVTHPAWLEFADGDCPRCDADRAGRVLAALDHAVQLALDAGFSADELIDTVGAMVYPKGQQS